MQSIQIPSPSVVKELAAKDDPQLLKFLKYLSEVMTNSSTVKAAQLDTGDYQFRILCQWLGERNKTDLATRMLSYGWQVIEHTEVESGHNEYDTLLKLRPVGGKGGIAMA